MAVPYTFGNATTSIPLSQLDTNFATAITIGNTAVYLGNTTTTFGNVTLNNVTINSGNSTVTKETVTTITSPAATALTIQSAGTTAMTIDTSQNVGIGVTPSAWSGVTALEQQGGALFSANTGDIELSQNAYRSGANYVYKNTARATYYQQNSGLHYWSYAPSGTAGTNITWTTAMAIDTSGNVGIGTTSPAYPLDISKNQSGAITSLRIANGNLGANSDSSLLMYTANGTWEIRAGRTTGSLQFFTTAPSEAMRIDGSGRLLINTTAYTQSSTAKFEVYNGSSYFTYGSSTVAAAYIYNPDTTASTNQPYLFLSDGSGLRGGMGINYTDAATWISGQNGIRFRYSGTGSGSLEAMRIDSSGNVGIGTSSTSGARLGVIGSASSGYMYVGDGTANMLIGTGAALSSDSSIPYLRSAGAIGFATGGGSERARIDSSGNLLVGTTDSSFFSGVGFKLVPSATAPTAAITGSSSSNTDVTYRLYSTGAAANRFYVGYGGQIYATSTTISALSDQSLKENIRDLETGLNEIMALRPRRFDWKDETKIEDKNVAGFVAQEVEKVLPDLVYDYQYNETEIKKSLKMGDILPTLVKAMQEQQAQISSLKAELDALKGTK